MIRVLHVLNDLRGGATMSAITFLRAAKSMGSSLEHYAVYPGSSGHKNDGLSEITTNCAALPISTWQKKRGPTTARGMLRLMRSFLTRGFGSRNLKSLSDLARHWRINVIHTNSAIIADGAHTARLLNIPHVWHIRESLGENGFMQFQETDLNVARTIADASVVMPLISRYVGKFFERNGVIDKTALVFDGVDTNHLREPGASDRGLKLRRKWGIPENAIVVGMVGGLKSNVKRHDLFVKSAIAIARRHSEVRFVVVGALPAAGERGRRTWAGKITEMAVQSGLGDKLVFTDHQPDMPAVWSAMDIYVHLCEVEGFSRAILEAMATATPVVAVDGGGNPEAVSHENNGLLIPPVDASACVNAVSGLIENMDLRLLYGVNAADEVDRRFSIATHYRCMEALFNDVVG